MRAALAPGCRLRSLSAYTGVSNHSQSRRCRCQSHHHAEVGSATPLLSRVHWVRPEMVVEVSYVEWTPDGLLRHVVYLGEREDKLAAEVRRSRPHAGEP